MEMFMTDEGEAVTLAEYYGQANDPDCGMTSEDLAEIAALEVGETTALGFTVVTRITDAEVFYIGERTPEYFFDAVGTNPIASDLVGWYRWADDSRENTVGPFATESDATAVREEPPMDTLQEMAWEDNNARSLGLL